jgi:hypothetical protein
VPDACGKFGGLFVGDPAACRRELTATLSKKLLNLDNVDPCVDRISDTTKNQSTRRLRMRLLRNHATVLPDYYMRGMPPTLTREAAVMADGRVLASFAKLSQADGTPPARRDVMLQQAFLAENKGGHGLHCHRKRHVPAWDGFFLKAWPLLKSVAPFLASHTLERSPLAMVVELRACYGLLSRQRDECEARNVAYAAELYHFAPLVHASTPSPYRPPPPFRRSPLSIAR